jgi:hypothetical protein
VFWLYFGCTDFPCFLQPQGHNAWSIRKLEFRDMFNILLEMRLMGVAGHSKWECRNDIHKVI